MLLTSEAYDSAEIAGMENLPNRIIEATRAVAFGQEGYPTKVATIPAVRRYVDVMHEGRSEATFRDILCGGITQDELDILQRVTRAVCELTQSHYGRRLAATGSLLRALNVVRQIRILQPDSHAVIFEVGHGSGYVGALLLAAGYGYASTDIAQAFYLYQSHLLEAIAPGKLVELALDPSRFDEIDRVAPGTALHVPWWKYFVARPEPRLRVDVATCSHALAEMHPNSLGYVVKFSRRLLQPEYGAFLFEGWGSTIHTPIWGVAKRFADHGYVIAHNDIYASVFVPADGGLTRGARTLPLPPPQPAPQHEPTPAPRRGLFRRAPPEPPEQGVLAVPDAAPGDIYHPPIHVTPENDLSRRLTEGRATFSARATVSLPEVLDMIRKVLGRDDLESDDEAFMRFVGVAY